MGNGASDLIDRLVRALRPDHAPVLAPTFRSTKGPVQKKIIVKLNSITQICTKISAFQRSARKNFPGN